MNNVDGVMNTLLLLFINVQIILTKESLAILSVAFCDKCKDDCSQEGKMTCGLSEIEKKYTLFPTECAFKAYSTCHSVELVITPLKFCINNELIKSRRMYGESCPLFCPNHYRPVCGMSKLRAYIYKTFNNACYFDMLACRGDELSEYIEVPLDYCQRHLMKNIFKENVVITGLNDYRDYHEY